jgi:hypothetical protein
VEEKLRTPNGVYLRTYYFDENSKLILIREKFGSSDNWERVLSYYFKNMTLIKVVDNKGIERTWEVDRAELKERIRLYGAMEVK